MKMTRRTTWSSTPSYPRLHHLVNVVLAFLVLETTPLTVYSQTPITPSGLNTGVNLSSTPPPGTVQYDITGGTRPGGGVNLFHSFGEFGVPTNNIANFLNDSGLPTSNILGRVTGGNVSSILGMIQTTDFGVANLFLVNPAGFLFGPNATVNIGGMMTFTTAEYLRLRELDGNNVGIFHADPTQTSVLTSAPVTEFGFIGSNPAAITFEGGQLTVAAGSGVALVGGNITLGADAFQTPSSITATGRTIQMISIGGPGEVAVDTGLPISGITLGTIALGQGTIVSTVGDLSVGDGSGGSISIRGGQLVATGVNLQTISAEGSPGVSGAVAVDVTGSAKIADSSIQTGSPIFFFSGAGGSISIKAHESLSIANTTIDTSAIGAAGDSGQVSLITDGVLSLTNSTVATTSFASGSGGSITMTGRSVILDGTHFITDAVGDPGFGVQNVRGGSLTVAAAEDVTISGQSSEDVLVTTLSGASLLDSGSVTISGNTVTLTNGIIDASMSDFGISTPSNGGTVEIRGNNISLNQFGLKSLASGGSESTGTGGTILFRGTDGPNATNIQLTASQVNASATTAGGGGTIEFQTNKLTINDHTDVATGSFGQGAGGTIAVKGAENITIESASRVLTDVVIVLPGDRQGGAGNITFEAQNLTVSSGSIVRAAALPDSTGNAGDITVRGTNGPAESILVDGVGSGIFSSTEGTGTGGNINLFASSVTIQNGGTLSATTSGGEATATGGTIMVHANTVSLNSGGTMTAASTGAGASGEVIVQGLASPANSVLMDGSGSGILTTTEGTGKGGNIFVDANSVVLQNGARVSSSSTGTGIAGDISINAGNQFTMANSSVTTEANQSSGGAIKITTNPNGTVLLTDSTISASVLDGTGGGGSVDIDPQFVILENSQILANSVFGPGGNIFITTNLLLPDSASVISASSQFGQQGNIVIQSPVSPASGKLVPLGQKPLIATSLLSQRCAALAGGSISSFTVAGRDSLPSEPGGWVSSPLALSISESENGHVTEADEMMSDKTPLLSVRKIAPSGFLTQAFAVDASGCQS